MSAVTYSPPSSTTSQEVSENNTDSTIFDLNKSRKSINEVTTLTKEESINMLQQLEHEVVVVDTALYFGYIYENSIIKLYNPTQYYINGIKFNNGKIETSTIILAPNDYAYITIKKSNLNKLEDTFRLEYLTTTEPVQEVIYPSDFTNNELVIEEDRKNRTYNIKVNNFPEKNSNNYPYEQENIFFVNYKYKYNNEYNEDCYFINLSALLENYNDELIIPIFHMNKNSEFANDDFQLLNFHFNGCFAKRSKSLIK